MSLPPYHLPSRLTPRPVGTRGCYQSGAVTAAFVVSENTRLYEVLTTRYACASIRIMHENFGNCSQVPGTNGPSSEATPAQAITVQGSVEVNTSILSGPWSVSNVTTLPLPLTWAGSSSVTIPPNGYALSDPIAYPFVAGQSIYVNSFATVPGVYPRPAGRYLNSALDEFSDDGYFATASGTSTTTSTTLSGNITAVVGAQLPIQPGTLSFYSGATLQVTDDGNGNLSGTGMSGTGTFNYTTGDYSGTLTTALSPAQISIKGYGRYGVTVVNDSMNRPRSGSLLNTIASRSKFCHAAVIGEPVISATARPFALALFSDSIGYGTGNSPDFGQSWVDYCCAQQCGVLKLSQPSEKMAQFATLTSRYRRMNTAIGRFDRAILAYGTNDYSSTLATLQANAIAAAQAILPYLQNGLNDLFVPTILPRTTGGIVTPYAAFFGPGTVASGSPSIRNAFNAWLYTMVGTYWGGVIDIASVLEASPASQAGAGNGQWISAAVTYDDTHPSQAGNQAVAAALGATGTTPHPAFVFP